MQRNTRLLFEWHQEHPHFCPLPTVLYRLVHNIHEPIADEEKTCPSKLACHSDGVLSVLFPVGTASLGRMSSSSHLGFSSPNRCRIHSLLSSCGLRQTKAPTCFESFAEFPRLVLWTPLVSIDNAVQLVSQTAGLRFGGYVSP